MSRFAPTNGKATTPRPSGLEYELYPRPRPFKAPVKLKVIVGVMVACTFLALVVVVAFARKKEAASGPFYEGFAQMVATNYVDGHPLDISRAQGLTTSLGRMPPSAAGKSKATPKAATTSTVPVSLGADAVSFDKATDDSTKSGVVETDYFWVEYDNGNLGLVAVVVHGSKSGPVLGAPPSLLPAPIQITTSTVVATGKPVAGGNSLSSEFVSQIDKWASAYASGDSTALYTLTGDTLKAHFRGLGGYKVLGNPVIVSSTAWTSKKPPKKLVVTIDVTMQSKKDPDVVVQSSYDLLLVNLTDAYPNVAAWGPAGSGASLTPYENAG